MPRGDKYRIESAVLSAGKSWTTTFSDLLLLLLTFFALKLSVSGITEAVPAEAVDHSASSAPFVEQRDFPKTVNLLQHIAQLETRGHSASNIRISDPADDGTIRLSIYDGCFVQGSTQLTFKSEELVRTLVGLAGSDSLTFEMTAKLSEEETKLFPNSSPWQVSQQRAAQVVRQMIDAGVDSSVIKAAGGGLAPTANPDIINHTNYNNGCLFVLVKPPNNTNES